MAKIVTITNPLTGQPAQVDQLDHTAQQIDDGLNIARGVSNPNLLDNWYFGNLVNQRGQTEYAAMGYMVDRWKNSSGNTTVLVSDSGLTMVGGTAYLSQKIEDSLLSELDGKIITISSLWTDNVLQTFSWVLNKSQSKLGNDGLDVYTTNNGFFVSRHIGEIQKTVKAAKLELGTQQTLAHQENGVWVLNEIPDYGEQLARCQRYQLSANPKRYGRPAIGVSTSQSSGAFVLNLPVTMRAIPTVTFRNLQVFYLGNNYNVTSINVSGMTDNAVLLDITFDATIPNGAALILVANEGSELLLTANL